MRAKALLFDKDGTLFDFQKTWAGWAANMIRTRAGSDSLLVAQMAEALGFDMSAELYLPESVVIAGTAYETVEAVLPFFDDKTLDELHDEFKASQSRIAPFEVVPLRLFLGQMLEDGLLIGIATNDSESSARAQLDQFAITEMFHYIAGFDSGYGGKPGAGMCAAFSVQTGIAPDQIVMIGDSLHDLHAGRAAGMQTIGVLTGVATAAELSPHADVVLPDIGHLNDWLRS